LIPWQSWVAIGIALAIPPVAAARRKRNKRVLIPAFALTLGAIGFGVAGILN
jgi:heme A synthase